MKTSDVKRRYWEKKWNEAPTVECACGCGELMKAVDRYGRVVRYISGHNQRVYPIDGGNPKTAAHKRWKRAHREAYRDSKRNSYRRKKLQLMILFDNRCAFCGLVYDGMNAAVFEFHHLDPIEKEGLISAMIRNAAFEKVLSEVKKCTLLCAHCHIIHHHGSW